MCLRFFYVFIVFLTVHVKATENWDPDTIMVKSLQKYHSSSYTKFELYKANLDKIVQSNFFQSLNYVFDHAQVFLTEQLELKTWRAFLELSAKQSSPDFFEHFFDCVSKRFSDGFLFCAAMNFSENYSFGGITDENMERPLAKAHNLEILWKAVIETLDQKKFDFFLKKMNSMFEDHSKGYIRDSRIPRFSTGEGHQNSPSYQESLNIYLRNLKQALILIGFYHLIALSNVQIQDVNLYTQKTDFLKRPLFEEKLDEFPLKFYTEAQPHIIQYRYQLTLFDENQEAPLMNLFEKNENNDVAISKVKFRILERQDRLDLLQLYLNDWSLEDIKNACCEDQLFELYKKTLNFRNVQKFKLLFEGLNGKSNENLCESIRSMVSRVGFSDIQNEVLNIITTSSEEEMIESEEEAVSFDGESDSR